MNRRDDWPTRLLEQVEAVRGRPYRLGETDCFRFACACVQAMTGEDLYARFAGSYATKREALRAIVAFGGGGAVEAVDALLGPDRRANVRLAQRGDWLLFHDGDDHLGVCLGAESAVLTPAGLGTLPTLSAVAAWRI